MINIDDVKEVLLVLSGKTADELEDYTPIISNSVYVISRLINDEMHSDSRAIYLAACKANYDFSLISSCDDVTSFTAGDVRITQSSNENSAKKLLDEAVNNVCDLINDNGFAFLGV